MRTLSSLLWDAVSGVAAAGALLLSFIVWLSQRRRDQDQADIQKRLASIEEARRNDEVERMEEARQAALVADVRVVEFRMERPGGSGHSDKVSITIENRGPSPARSIDVAMLESEDRAPSAGLGEAVEFVDQFGGYSGRSRMGYFQIPWELPTRRPLKAFEPGERVIFPFWLRYRPIGNESFRIVWEDGRGAQVAHPVVPFDPDPAGRH
jgi:hypothetical protein